MGLNEIKAERKEKASELAALYTDLENMRSLLNQHEQAESEAKTKLRAGQIELSQLVEIQAKRQAVAGLINEIQQEIAAAEDELEELERQADVASKHEQLAAFSGRLSKIQADHAAAIVSLRDDIMARVESLLSLERCWTDLHGQGLQVLRSLGISDDNMPSAKVQAQDAQVLASAERNGVNLQALLTSRYWQAASPWFVKNYKEPIPLEGADAEGELNRALYRLILETNRKGTENVTT